LGACETGVSRTTSAGLRVMAGAACDMQNYSTHSLGLASFVAFWFSKVLGAG
jgi:hypothetical protein